MQRRELKLLARDRNFLVQTTVTPLLVVGFQLALTVGAPGGFSLSYIDLTHLAALGFGIAAYTLMFSAFQTLNNEGGALWLLYTLPRSLGRILLDKALLWGAWPWPTRWPCSSPSPRPARRCRRGPSC